MAVSTRPSETPETGTETEAAYDRFAAAYRQWWAPVIAPFGVRLLDRLDPMLPVDRSATILDIGTGTGTLAVAALDRWPRVRITGVDPARRMLEMAQADARGAGVGERLTVHVGEAGRLPLPDASVDAAMSSFVLQLVPKRAAAVREAFRVLRPGGAFACVTWRQHADDFKAEAAFDEVLDELDLDFPEPPKSSDRAYASPASAAAELRRAGFRSVRGWEEWLEHRFTPGSYLELLEHWIEDDGFAALDEPMRRRLRAAALRRLEQLSPDALVWRRPLVGVVGRRPDEAADSG